MKIKEFNKKNLLEFAKHIYSEKSGWIHYQPLCRFNLTKKVNNEIMHCVLGEMYSYFCDGISAIEKRGKFKEIISEDDIINVLVVASNCKEKNEEILRESLISLNYANDDVGVECFPVIKEIRVNNTNQDILIERAKKCSEQCVFIANSFLR